MEISTEWNLICRICLQDGEMRSIFDKDDNNFLISDKIMFCSNISISKGVNLPEHICLKCLDDLHTAYIFRSKCENSNTVLQSFVKQNAANDYITYSTNGEVYEYKPPEGLNVKRIRNKKTSENTSQIVELEEFQDEEELFEEEERIDSEYDEIDEKYENPEDAIEYSKTRNNSQSEPDKNSVIKKFPAQVKLRIKGENISNNEEYEVIQSDNVFSIKPINNEDYKSIRKSKVKVVSGETITKEDGSTEIRICKNIRSNTPKPLKFCDICGNTYKHKHALDAHMRRHRNEKPFKCEVCGRGFVLNVELNCHMRTHTGQKPYACRYCGRRFSDFGSRIKHERSHTGERPYPCETCGKAFAYSYGLSSHMLTHTGEKNFSCEKCGKSFSKKHHLKNHLNTHAKRESRILGNNNFELQEIKEENTIMPVENFESEQFTENKTNYEEMNDNSEYLLAVLDSDNNSYIEEINIVEIKQEQYDVNDTIIVESR